MEEQNRISEISEKLKPIFMNNPVYKAVLFGSYAKGTFNENSDIDIIIDTRGELRGLNFYSVLDEMTEILQKPVELIEISEIKKGAGFFDNVNSGVVLYER